MSTITITSLPVFNNSNFTYKKPELKVNSFSITDILELTETSPKAIIVIERLNFFLKTDADRQQFVTRWIDGYKGNLKNTTAIMRLSKDIGSSYYTYNNYSELEKMDIFDALERLFLHPINVGMRMEYERLGASLRQLYDLKMDDPKLSLMTVLLFV
ncbi:hypothetical protein D3C75_551130 [compost metagenome]